MIHFDEYFSDGLVQPPTSQIEREMATCSDSSTIFCLISGGYTDRESSQNNVCLIFVTLNWLVAYSKLIGLGGWWSFNFEANEEQFQFQIKEFKRLKCFKLKWYSTSRSLVIFVSRSTDVGGNISWEVRWINTSYLGHPPNEHIELANLRCVSNWDSDCWNPAKDEQDEQTTYQLVQYFSHHQNHYIKILARY